LRKTRSRMFGVRKKLKPQLSDSNQLSSRRKFSDDRNSLSIFACDSRWLRCVC
jgi:hypothetical protein